MLKKNNMAEKTLKDPKTQLWEYMQRLDRLVKSFKPGLIYTQHQHQSKIQHVYHKLLHASPLRKIEKQTVTTHVLLEKLHQLGSIICNKKHLIFYI